jgi:hypothetical protein
LTRKEDFKIFSHAHDNVINIIRRPDVTIIFDIAGEVVKAAVLAHAETEARLLSGTLLVIGDGVSEICFYVFLVLQKRIQYHMEPRV